MNTVHALSGTCGSAVNLPVDLVRVATSRRIEADYEERGVFPALRRPTDKAGSSTATVHWCTPTLVDDVLTDAHQRREQVRGACQAAYTTFIKALEEAIKQSKQRYEWLSGAAPKLSHEDCSQRSVYVIPSQFESIDLPADLKLPGSPDGPPRRATYRDRAGRLCSVARAFWMWPQAYHVTINFTSEERRERQKKEEDEKKAKSAEPKFKSLEDYRRVSVIWFSGCAKSAIPTTKPGANYEYDPAILQAVRQKVQEAEALLLTGRISPRSVAGTENEKKKPPRATLRLVHSASGASP